MGRKERTMRVRAVLVIGILLALTGAGCGGGGDGDGDGVATAGGSTSPTASASPGRADDPDAALKYVQCMRENGVPNMADPKVSENGEIQLNLNAEGADPGKVDAAQEKCRTLLPNGGEPRKIDPQLLEQLRQYAKCMRENGVPDFPDPTDQGLQVNGNKFPPDDPKMKAAGQKCSKYMPEPPAGQGGLNQESAG
jgi:hypothetical protein